MQASQCASKWAAPCTPPLVLPTFPQHLHTQLSHTHESRSGVMCQAFLGSPGPQLVSSTGAPCPWIAISRSGCASCSSAWHQRGQSGTPTRSPRGPSMQVKCVAAEMQAEAAQRPAHTSSWACPPIGTAADGGTAQAKEQEWQSRQALYASQAGTQTQQPGRTTPDLRAARAQRTLQMQVRFGKLQMCVCPDPRNPCLSLHIIIEGSHHKDSCTHALQHICSSAGAPYPCADAH
eukprot:1159239-Pelagomonas_calceolata.AAC.1